ncbi:DUF1566 domain-containing protein [Vibrio sp. SM6]|uniref:DUF1566 domain-containing protein n=1 Tax=Vibrio agarilyticus TaxID=2726741 RepID=A0A7X8YFI3_9VIBR|nr:DUF1566 domain-containing protein [Vibrio agarilyticus]NLS11948.1 DUF1566 domain-containing protein [Vibrio agarilyticus]
MNKPSILGLVIAASLATPMTVFAAEDIDNGYYDYIINRTVEDLTPADRKLAALIVSDCYLGCHRPALEEVPETLSPKLEGFDPQYFYNQWVDMDNERTSGISSQMKLKVYGYPPRDLATVALFMSERKMKYNPTQEALDSEAFKRGKAKYDASCKMCHGEQGASTHERYPPLKGQMPMYIVEQMRAYRDETRTNRDAPIMYPFAKMYSEEDYRDIATYVSGQKPVQIEYHEFISGIGMPAPQGFKLPDSGQIQNFTDTKGEDSDYINAPLDYTISESGKVTIDNNTKLMWEREASRIWMTALEGEQYCENLELDGYQDWRFPLMKELQSIADYGNFRPAIDTNAFPNMPRMAAGIWTFPKSDHPDHVWHIGFPDAHIMGQHTASTKLVRCVRADNGAAYHNMSYVDNQNGTVTENVTQRMWQKHIDFQQRPWEEAMQYCENLNLGGHQDWRLPNVKEAVSIVNYNKTSPAIDEQYFPDTPSKSFFWTSSSDVAGPFWFARPLNMRKDQQTAEELDLRTDKGQKDSAWAVGYQIGSGLGMQKSMPFYTRCIRTIHQ